MKTVFVILSLTFSFQLWAKMELPKEIKSGPMLKDSCGSFQDGVKSMQRLQETSNFESDGHIAFYNFAWRGIAALYYQKMIQEKNLKLRSQYREQYLLACRNAS